MDRITESGAHLDILFTMSEQCGGGGGVFIGSNILLFCKSFYSPTSILSWFTETQLGRTSPKKMDTPMMMRFRDEFRSTYCRLDNPTAVKVPVCE